MNHTTEYPVKALESDDQMHHSFFTSITHLGLIKVEGPDAKKFLQGQLTCHLEELTSDSFRLGAHCNVQGRALSTFYIYCFQESYFFVLDRSIISDWLNVLKKYSVFFKVSLSEVSDQFGFFGWQGSTYPVVNAYQLQLESGGCILLGLPSDASTKTPELRSRVLAIVPNGSEKMPSYQKLFEHDSQANAVVKETDYGKALWMLSDIMSGMAHVNAETAGQYIPIELNYDWLEGIHFKKGCYTGQEIIARIHFRGKPKFRIAYAQLSGITDVQANQSLYIYEEANKVLFGKVFSSVKEGQKIHALLLVNVAWLQKQDVQSNQQITLAEPLGVVHICSKIHDTE
jgi:tRNA-modifying protein YgfZ